MYKNATFSSYINQVMFMVMPWSTSLIPVTPWSMWCKQCHLCIVYFILFIFFLSRGESEVGGGWIPTSRQHMPMDPATVAILYHITRSKVLILIKKNGRIQEPAAQGLKIVHKFPGNFGVFSLYFCPRSKGQNQK